MRRTTVFALMAVAALASIGGAAADPILPSPITDQAEELGSQVKLRLIEDDYRVVRVFEGRSHFRTYLTTVIMRIFLDERVKAWGKWRPSREACRLGPTAVAFERLTTRDHLTADEAIETLCSRDPSVSAKTLRTLADRLPARAAARRHTDEEALEAVPAGGPPSDHLVVLGQARVGWTSARAALSKILDDLSPRERLLIQLRYVQGCRVSDVARLVGEDPKPLYRHYDQLLVRLKRELSLHGVSREILDELFLDGVEDGGEVPALRRTASASVSHDDGDARSTMAGG